VPGSVRGELDKSERGSCRQQHGPDAGRRVHVNASVCFRLHVAR
jgi:hypothetical protein